ncbi:MAG: DUF3160 domain-containing protein [Bacteroidetes bacterium]|nr:DUF3160 domain-containing protein [Bacteroidota bacterium]
MTLVSIIVVSLILIIVAVGYWVVTQKTPIEAGKTDSGVDSLQAARAEMEAYYASEFEKLEGSEYSPVSWNAMAASPIQVDLAEWPPEYDPTENDVRESVWWNYFNPSTKRAFTGDERESLLRDGFFLEETDPLNYIAYDDMIDLYNDLYTGEYDLNYSTVPVFISSDFLLHVYHVAFDRMLQDVEEGKFFFRLQNLVAAMTNGLREEWKRETSAEVRQAFEQSLAFFSVAQKLLDSTFVPDTAIAPRVAQEVAQIESASATSTSVILGEKQDFTQFKPRGHYTRSDRLSRYFRAMMWFGRSSFPLHNDRLTLAALVITKVWSDPRVRNQWRSLAEPIEVLIGAPDDLGPVEYVRVGREIFGDDMPTTPMTQRDKLGTFIGRALELSHARIADKAMRGSRTPRQAAIEFRFLGQRFIPDAYIFTRLTSPRVGSDIQPRNRPKPADLMTILGSPFAERLLADDFSIPGYKAGLDSLRGEFTSLPDKTWTQSVYWSWLHCLRAVLSPKDRRYPFFMRGESWVAKSLLTALASWSELRHDTILYSKQSYAEMGGGDEDEEIPPPPPQPKSYVEPDLEFFNRFVSLVHQTAATLSDHRLLSDEYRRKFSLYLDRLMKLREIVRKELLNLDITEDEYEMLLHFSHDIAGVVIPETAGDRIEEKYKQMAIISDVHTDTFSRRVLEVGIGVPQRMYVAVKDKPGGSRICVGFTFTYYEFVQPVDQRLTDEEWKGNIYRKENPEIAKEEPAWVRQLRPSSK